MPDQILQEIKDRLNIADIIGGYIQLKKAGGNFKAVCPFHSEKTPSLMISPSKQIWHCFGCGEGGDIFGFVMRYEKLDFRETLKVLSDKAGVVLPSYRPPDIKEQSEKDLLLRINDFTARFYHKVLIQDTKGKQAYEYLRQRGLNDKTIKQWQIGFAPEEFHFLEKALSAKQVKAEDMVKAGVSVKNEKGQIYDRFRGRITFPIMNHAGDVVGFSARIFKGDEKQAKYVNSPETLVYNKSQLLFGLNFAKEAIRNKDEAVIVEGQMDCISAHQAGMENTVATSGTALTDKQLDTLGRYAKNLKFCFDADAAGLSASRRAGELALPRGFKLKTIQLKGAKDPDELIQKSPGLWEKAVSQAIWFLDVYINFAKEKFAEDQIAQKHYLSSEVIPFLAFISDPLEQDHYVQELTDKFGISERVVREQISKKNYTQQANRTLKQQDEIKTGSATLEKEILGGMLKYPEFLRTVLQESRLEEFTDFEIRRIVTEVIEKLKAENFGKTVDWNNFNPNVVFPSKGEAGEVVAKEALFMVESFLEETDNNETAVLRQLNKSFAIFKINALKREQAALSFKIKQAENIKDKQELAALNDKFAETAVLRMKFEKLT